MLTFGGVLLEVGAEDLLIDFELDEVGIRLSPARHHCQEEASVLLTVHLEHLLLIDDSLDRSLSTLERLITQEEQVELFKQVDVPARVLVLNSRRWLILDDLFLLFPLRLSCALL